MEEGGRGSVLPRHPGKPHLLGLGTYLEGTPAPWAAFHPPPSTTTHMFAWPCGEKKWSVVIIKPSPQGRPGALLLTRRPPLELSSEKKGLMTQPHHATAQNPGCSPPAGGPGGGRYSRARLGGRAVKKLRGLEARGAADLNQGPLGEEHRLSCHS